MGEDDTVDMTQQTPGTAPTCRIQDLFIEQARRTPDRPAVISPVRSLSYAELRSLSRMWALKLRQLGARPNTLVAVVMEKGWEQVVAVLGILESGAAYLPVDLNVPQQRLWYLLQNSEVQIVMTQSWLDSKIQWPPGTIRLQVDRTPPSCGTTESSDHPQSPDDLAYVLYTSGSTGDPKGVMIAHRGLINCIVETNRSFCITDKDRVLAVTALHHDMSVYDIFGLLAAGGAIVMPRHASSRAPDHWAELIEREHITIWNSVPAFMEMLLDYAAGQRLLLPDRLRLAFLGGDWISTSAPCRIQSHFGEVNVISVGGPTETTVWNIWYPIRRVEPEWKSIPYGHPIANTHYYVLDEALQDCPVGSPGELCCAGVGLMKGYWRDEEHTRTRFAAHPRTGERIYRTGDRGRLGPDGEIEFLGRIDSQVKIGGQRIELGEIEFNLNQYPGLKQAAVTAVLSNGQKRLAAYLVADGGRSIASQDVRSFLERRLPCYMIPSVFVPLTSLPLNSNGKVDRSALPIPEAPSPEPGQTVAAASANELEDAIGEVWCQILSLDQVGPNDNFFDLGGTSLLLVHTHAALQKRLSRTLSVTDLFEFPSVRALGRHLDGRMSGCLATTELDVRANKQRAAMARRRMDART